MALASANAVLPLSLVGIVSGLLTGLVILAFRFCIETVQKALLAGNPENYEGLPWYLRLVLPVAGGLAIALLFRYASQGSTQVGVVHVMERFALHRAYLPLRNALIQFAGALLSITSGQSVGREGPGIHLGAAGSNLLGQWLGLPNNSLRTLVACGTAASIAASFNTPIAGVIFAMEVVMMEYTIVGFTPVIIAAVVATWLSRAVYGADPAFAVPPLELASLWELPFIVLLGITLGALAAGFIALVGRLDVRFGASPPMPRMAVAAGVTGICAILAPQVMGIGYDTVELTLLGAMGLGSLILITILKLIATAACAGLGVPAGVIGPTLVIGATAGGAFGVIGQSLAAEYASDPGLYAMLGMAAMMGGTLQAPLAALMAILELTANPNVILPGMLAIVAATLTAKGIFRKDSIFVTILAGRGVDYFDDPVARSMNRTGVAAVMRRHFATSVRYVTESRASRLLAGSPRWIVIIEDDEAASAIRAGDLTQYLLAAEKTVPKQPIDLINAAGRSEAVVRVPIQATLREAMEALDRGRADVACVVRDAPAPQHRVCGVLTREAITAMAREPG